MATHCHCRGSGSTFWTGRRPPSWGPTVTPSTATSCHPSRIGVGCSPVDGLTVTAPLVVGEPAVRRSELAAATVKTGRSGELLFVTVRHEYRQDDALRLVEEQDLVYRSDTGTSTPHSRVAEPLGQQSTPWAAQPMSQSGAAVPVQRADRQFAPHSLRRGLHHRHRRVSRPGGARSAPGRVHGRARPCAQCRPRNPRFRISVEPTCVRRRPVPRAGHSAGR